MNPPTGQGTGHLNPPWPWPGESRCGSLKVLLVISPSFSLNASCCVCFFVLIIENSFQRRLNLKFPYSQPEPSWLCGGESVSYFHGWVSQGWFQQGRFRKTPSIEGPTAHGALPKVGHASAQAPLASAQAPKALQQLILEKADSIFPPPASGHRFHSSLAVPSKIIFYILLKKPQPPRHHWGHQSDNALIASVEGKLLYYT